MENERNRNMLGEESDNVRLVDNGMTLGHLYPGLPKNRNPQNLRNPTA